MIDGLAADLLGRHVPGASHDRAFLGDRFLGSVLGTMRIHRCFPDLGQAEIENLDPVIVRNEDVLRL